MFHKFVRIIFSAYMKGVRFVALYELLVLDSTIGKKQRFDKVFV